MTSDAVIGLTTKLTFNREDYIDRSRYTYGSGNLTEGIAYLNSVVTISNVTSEDLGS